MRVFNEEEKVSKSEVILILTRDEAKALIEMAEAGHAARNHRKPTWAKILDALNKMAVF